MKEKNERQTVWPQQQRTVQICPDIQPESYAGKHKIISQNSESECEDFPSTSKLHIFVRKTCPHWSQSTKVTSCENQNLSYRNEIVTSFVGFVHKKTRSKKCYIRATPYAKPETLIFLDLVFGA